MALAPPAPGAGEPAAPPAAKFFQVYLNDEQLKSRLYTTYPYSLAILRDPKIGNCVNLSLVTLGLVNPAYYLRACGLRLQQTTSQEIAGYISSSMAQCGKNPTVNFNANASIPNKFVLNSIVTAQLNPSYATMIYLEWLAGGGHAVVVRKNEAGVLQYIDPQISGPDGLYPFVINGQDNILQYLNANVRYTGFIVSDVIDKEDSLSQKCMTTKSPMDEAGGRRKSRKNGKKTKKGRKHHGVRTRRRRH